MGKHHRFYRIVGVFDSLLPNESKLVLDEGGTKSFISCPHSLLFDMNRVYNHNPKAVVVVEGVLSADKTHIDDIKGYKVW